MDCFGKAARISLANWSAWAGVTSAVIEGHQLVLGHPHIFEQPHDGGRQVVAGHFEQAIVQPDELPGLDGHIVNFHSARGSGDFAALHIGSAFSMAACVASRSPSSEKFSRAATPWGTVRLGTTFTCLFVVSSAACFAAMMSFVVGQNQDAVGGQALDGFDHFLGGRIHGLAAGNDGGRAQRGHDARQPLAGGHGDDGNLPGLHFGERQRLGRRLLAAGFLGELLQQVFHVHVGDNAQLFGQGHGFEALGLEQVHMHAIEAVAFTHLDEVPIVSSWP